MDAIEARLKNIVEAEIKKHGMTIDPDCQRRLSEIIKRAAARLQNAPIEDHDRADENMHMIAKRTIDAARSNGERSLGSRVFSKILETLCPVYPFCDAQTADPLAAGKEAFPLTERRQKAFDFAGDVAKQLITLSTGIIAIILIFSKDMIGPANIAGGLLRLLFWACVVYLLSIVCGVWHLYVLTGELETKLDHSPTTRGRNSMFSCFCQVFTFLGGTGLIVYYVWLTVQNR